MKQTIKSVILGLLLIVLALGIFAYFAPAPPDALATGDLAPITEITINSAAITEATNFDGQWLIGNNPQATADIFMFIDQGDVNTLTLVLQVSPDNSTWLNHSASSALLSNNAADANSYATATIHGAYYRIAATVANTNTVTPTIKMILRR